MQKNLKPIRSFLLNHLGLNYSESRDNELYTKLTNAANNFGFENTGKYIGWLLENPNDDEIISKLAEFLTIGETYFFREKKSLDFIEYKYLPEIISKHKNEGQNLNIWCAACATGEEPYSIAILLKRTIPEIQNWNINLLATDINEAFLEKARTGIYTKWSFRLTPETFKNQHFKQVSENRFQIDQSIKEMVTFSNHNLAKGPFPPVSFKNIKFDIILCRNVLIYFSPEMVQHVASNFYKTLAENGVLIVSAVEASSLLSSAFQHFSYQGASVFEKDTKIQPYSNRKFPKLKTTNLLKDKNQFLEKDTINKVKPEEKLRFNSKQFISAHHGKMPLENEKEADEPQKSTYQRALNLFNSNKIPDAENLVNRLISGEEDVSAPIFILAAQIKANMGYLEEAEELCKKAIESDKVDAWAHYLLATILNEKGKVEEAIKALNNTLFLDNEFVLAYYALGSINIRIGKVNEGKKHFRNALSSLEKYAVDTEINGGEGLTAGRLNEIINSFLRN